MEYLTEEQQVERLRRWWKEYGLSVIAGLVIAIIVSVSWRAYHVHTIKVANTASMIYATLLAQDAKHQTMAAVNTAAELKQDFSATPYASLAAFWLAKQAVLAEKYDLAQQEFSWVLHHSKVNDFKQIAILRSARVALQQNQPAVALKMVLPVLVPAYASMAYEIAGDANQQLGNASAARAAYQKAVSLSTDNRPLLAAKVYQ